MPAKTLVTNCYKAMFSGCTNLKYIVALFTTTPSNTYTQEWVKNITKRGTFVKSSSATWTTSGDNGKPANFSAVTLDGNGGPILWTEHKLPNFVDGEYDGETYEDFMEDRVRRPYTFEVRPFIHEGTMEFDGVTYQLYKKCGGANAADEYEQYALSDTEYTNPVELSAASCLSDIDNRFKPFRYILYPDKSEEYDGQTGGDNYFFLMRP